METAFRPTRSTNAFFTYPSDWSSDGSPPGAAAAGTGFRIAGAGGGGGAGGGATGGGAVAGGTGAGRCVWRHHKTPPAATSNTTIAMRAPRLMP